MKKMRMKMKTKIKRRKKKKVNFQLNSDLFPKDQQIQLVSFGVNWLTRIDAGLYCCFDSFFLELVG